MELSKEGLFGGATCPVALSGLISSIEDSAGVVSFDDILFVGAETSLVWKGYMDGSVRSGDRGAQEVVNVLKG